MAAPIVFERRMTDAEGLMWRLEKDPFLSSTFGNVTFLDRPLDHQRLLRRMAHAVEAVPRLRQRVQPAPTGLSSPVWVDDDQFDLARHVRHVALPKPGTDRQLLDLAALLVADPFDRARPLWEFIVVDGLRGGRGALIQKLHHTVVDGEAGIRMSMQFLDLERDAPEPPPVEPAPPSPPEERNPLADLLTGTFRLPLALARQGRDLLADPTRVPATAQAVVGATREIVTQLTDTERAHSPLWTARSLGRRLEVLRAPLEATKAAAHHLGGSLNTAFVTIATEAAARYHRELGHPVDTLRASMAISTRTSGSGANAFTLARLVVPTGDLPIAERFRAIQAATEGARASSASASLEVLSGLAALLPTSVVTRLARQQSQTVDFATSNVRGAPIPVYVAGARVVSNHPVGPLAGVAFNLTLLSYDGSLDMGLHLDTAAVAEPQRLLRAHERAVRDLLAVVDG
ncbi:MAG: wax ester/triacylglycerol synthase domain-containing protein [Acidimicrobiales bacterium]